jgi:hypothetical protein
MLKNINRLNSTLCDDMHTLDTEQRCLLLQAVCPHCAPSLHVGCSGISESISSPNFANMIKY